MSDPVLLLIGVFILFLLVITVGHAAELDRVNARLRRLEGRVEIREKVDAAWKGEWP